MRIGLKDNSSFVKDTAKQIKSALQSELTRKASFSEKKLSTQILKNVVSISLGYTSFNDFQKNNRYDQNKPLGLLLSDKTIRDQIHAKLHLSLSEMLITRYYIDSKTAKSVVSLALENTYDARITKYITKPSPNISSYLKLNGYKGFLDHFSWISYVDSLAEDLSYDELQISFSKLRYLISTWDGNNVVDLLEVIERINVLDKHDYNYAISDKILYSSPANFLEAKNDKKLLEDLNSINELYQIYALDRHGQLLISTENRQLNASGFGVELLSIKDLHDSFFFEEE